MDKSLPVLESEVHATMPISDESAGLIKIPSKPSNLAVPPSISQRTTSSDANSLISTDEFSELRLARTSSRQPEHEISQTERPSSWREMVQASWLRNKGLVLVIIAQCFNTLMAVTTRLLETDGNHGKGMHPFQVIDAKWIALWSLTSV
jgi:hypothetical protein